jgi:hypothetical protein
LATEDANSDLACDSLDCQGAVGAPGNDGETGPPGAIGPAYAVDEHGLVPAAVVSLTVADGLLTVPVGKAWKVVAVNGGAAGIAVTPTAVYHNQQCNGFSQSAYSSCLYTGYMWELDGVPIGKVTHCHNCTGDVGAGCWGDGSSSDTSNCPVGINVSLGEIGEIANTFVNIPFWLAGGQTFKVNPGNTFVSVLEFDAG